MTIITGFSPRAFIHKTAIREAISRPEMRTWVRSCVDGSVSREQIGAWLMAVKIQGLSPEATAFLTAEMAASGTSFDFRGIGKTVDKHSSGGVSDGTSLVLAPLAACLGLNVPMMSGHGLDHTGGTLDKLEAIPGFHTKLSLEEVYAQLKAVGGAIFAQTDDIAPADGLFYAIRDVTDTVASIPLIAASIMSKKLAEGADALVLNVTTGAGAFMEKLDDARVLARLMIAAAKEAGKRAVAVITSMDQPLAPFVGNALEIEQAIRIMRGETAGFERFIKVTMKLATEMARLSDPNILTTTQFDDYFPWFRWLLCDGRVLAKFGEIIAAQGGDQRVIDNLSLLPEARGQRYIYAGQPGFVQAIDTKKLGFAALSLGAGREKEDDVIDPAVGLKIGAFIGDRVAPDSTLATICFNDEVRLNEVAARVQAAFTLGSERVEPPQLIIETIV